MWNVVQELRPQRCINDTLYQFILNYFKYPSIWNYSTLTTLSGVQVEQVELARILGYWADTRKIMV